jgi:hypothetical protein
MFPVQPPPQPIMTGEHGGRRKDSELPPLLSSNCSGESVKVTVDLRWVEHRALRSLCLWYAEQLDVPQVAAAEMFRALLQMALTEERLAAQLGGALAETGGSRRRPPAQRAGAV